MTDNFIRKNDEDTIAKYRKAALAWFDEAFPHYSTRYSYADVLAEYLANQDGITLTHYRGAEVDDERQKSDR